MGTHVFKTKALLLVLPTIEYQKRVPVIIGTSLTDMAVDSFGTLDETELTTPWKMAWCATQSCTKVQAQQIQKHTVKKTKPITLPSVSITIVWGHTKLKCHGMKLNLIADPSGNNQLPSSVQCTLTYCNLEPGSNRVIVGLRNVSAKQITIPSMTVVCQIQLANMVLKTSDPKNRTHQKIKRRINLGFLIN